MCRRFVKLNMRNLRKSVNAQKSNHFQQSKIEKVLLNIKKIIEIPKYGIQNFRLRNK